jgi:hypothetical protein
MTIPAAQWKCKRDYITTTGILYGEGTTFRSWDLPTSPDIVPVDERAKRIAKWYTAHRFDIGAPTTAFDGVIRLPYLPMHMLFAAERRLFELPGHPLELEDECGDELPRYVLAAGCRIGSEHFESGEKPCFTGWPFGRWFRARVFEGPANAAGENVWAYTERYQDAPGFPLVPSPWNALTNTLCLPPMTVARAGSRVPPYVGGPAVVEAKPEPPPLPSNLDPELNRTWPRQSDLDIVPPPFGQGEGKTWRTKRVSGRRDTARSD